MADSPEQATAGFLVGGQYLGHRRAEGQVGVADDACYHRPVASTTLFGHFPDEAGLPHRLKVFRAIAAVVRHALDEDSPDHIVASTGVGVELIK